MGKFKFMTVLAIALSAIVSFSACDKAKQAASKATESAKDAAGGAVDAAKDAADGAVDAAKDAAGKAGDMAGKAVDAAGGAVDAAKDAADGAVDAAKDAAGKAGDMASDALGTASSPVSKSSYAEMLAETKALSETAKDSGAGWNTTGKLIEKAEAAAKSGDYDLASSLLVEATRQSEMAISQAQSQKDAAPRFAQ